MGRKAGLGRGGSRSEVTRRQDFCGWCVSGRGWVKAGARGAAAFMLLATVIASPPARAFDLFGFHLFGSSDDAASIGIVDPITYETTISTTTGDTDLAARLSDVSLLVNQQELPPSGLVGLLQRAKDDQANLVAKLFEEARYGAIVRILIDGRPFESIGVTEEVSAGHKVAVAVEVTPGPEFTFGKIVISGGGEETSQAAAEAGLSNGAIASSTTVVSAEGAIVLARQSEGYAYADIADRKVVADHTLRELDVTIAVKSGPRTIIDGVMVKGAERLEEDFLIEQADIPQGVLFDPAILERARVRMSRLEALASVSVHMAEVPDANGHAPVIIEVAERKLRTIGVGALYSSTEGLGGEAFWVHRNLFGRAETLRVEAAIGKLLMADSIDEYDGRFSVLYGEPGIFGADTRLDLKATVLQEDPDPYNRRGAVVESLITYNLTDNLSLSGGVTFDWSRIDDAFGRNYYSLVTTPVSLTYDSRDNILDATSGILARLTAEPQFEINDSSLYFATDAELRYFAALDDDSRFVIAARGLAGTIWGADAEDIPAHRRYYAGGGGSVRGYEYLNIGPRVDGFGPIGGLARVEGSLEARIKVTDTIGIVPFVDAGFVTETAGFGGKHDFQVGAGIGLRYYTAVGPIRLDFAVPLDPGPGDPDFAVYFGIGQAF